jgi:hypothetical protein
VLEVGLKVWEILVDTGDAIRQDESMKREESNNQRHARLRREYELQAYPETANAKHSLKDATNPVRRSQEEVEFVGAASICEEIDKEIMQKLIAPKREELKQRTIGEICSAASTYEEVGLRDKIFITYSSYYHFDEATRSFIAPPAAIEEMKKAFRVLDDMISAREALEPEKLPRLPEKEARRLNAKSALPTKVSVEETPSEEGDDPEFPSTEKDYSDGYMEPVQKNRVCVFKENLRLKDTIKELQKHVEVLMEDKLDLLLGFKAKHQMSESEIAFLEMMEFRNLLKKS